MARPPNPPDIEVELHFLSVAEGGKIRDTLSGYRADQDFGVPGLFHAGHHEFLGQESVSPGLSVRSELWLLDPLSQHGRLYPGFAFKVHEGPKLVARAVVVRVFNPALRAEAHQPTSVPRETQRD